MPARLILLGVVIALTGFVPTARAAIEMPMLSGTYVGDGTNNRKIRNLSFQPDVVIIKGSGTTPSVVRTATMASDQSKALGAATALASGQIRSFDLDGFTLGTDPAVNAPGRTYHWVAFQAAANRMAVGSYLGTGAVTPTVSLGFAPEYLMILGNVAGQAVQRFVPQNGDTSMLFNGLERTDLIQSMSPSGFGLGIGMEVNQPGATYHYVAWRRTPAKILSGSYVGSGADDRLETGLGFRPYHLFVGGPASPTVQRFGQMHGDLTLHATPDSGFANGIQTFVPDGFQLGTHATVNAAGRPYYWVAFQNDAAFDLDLAMTADRASLKEGEPATYRLLLLNLGPTRANQIEVTDLLPATLTYQSSVASAGAYVPGTGVWSLTSLAAGDTATLDLVAIPNPGTRGTTITNTASVTTTDVPDLNPPNDNASVALRVPAADLGLQWRADDLTPYDGERVTEVLRIANAGPDSALGVEVTATLPGSLTPVSIVPSRGTWQPTSGRWWIGDLAVGDSAFLSIAADAHVPGVGSTITTSARITATTTSDMQAGNDSSAVALVVQAPGLRVVSGSYVGDGAALRAVTGVGFQPDLVIVKAAAATGSVARTKFMSGDASKELGAATALVSGRIRSLDPDGFTLGSDPSVNASGTTYYWSALIDAPGLMRTGTYTGNGLDNQSIAGLGFQPGYVMVLSSAARPAIHRFAAEAADAALPFTAGLELADRIQRFEPDGFQLGAGNETNGPGVIHHYVAWNAVTGLIASDAFLGDGIDNRTIESGFRPDLLLVQHAGTAAVHRHRAVGGDLTLPFVPTAPFPNGIQALTPRGFQVGSDPSVNGATRTSYFVALRNGHGADLGLAGTVDHAVPNEGDTVAFITTLTNHGPDAAGAISVIAPLPAGLTLESQSVSQGAFDPGSGVWTVGALAGNAAATLGLRATVDSGTAGFTLVHLSHIGATDQPDAFADDDTARVAVTVQLADLALAYTVDDATPTENEAVTLTLKVTNLGPQAATGVSVDAPLPAGLHLGSATPSQGTWSSGTGAWPIGTIAAGGFATLTLRAGADPGTQGTSIASIARVTASDQADPTAADDADTVTLRVQRAEFRVITGSYVGDGGASRAITGIGFQPDLVILRGGGATASLARTKTMPAESAKELGAATPLVTGRVRSLDADGFTVSGDAAVNASGTVYYWTAFLEAPGQMKVGSYTGTGTDNLEIGGVGFQPEYLIVLSAAAEPAYQRFAPEVGDASLPFGSGKEISDRIQRLGPDGFQVGVNADVNAAGVTNYYVAWNASAARARTGLYLGNALDDRDLTDVGFRPSHLIVKRQDTSPAIQRPGSVAGDLSLPATSAAGFPNGIQALRGDGFQLGSDGTVNASGRVFFWVAMRDLPSLDLAVSMSVSDSTPNVGELVTYTVKVVNRGPEDATGVGLEVLVPAGVTYQTHIPGRGVYDPGSGQWQLGAVVDGDSASLQIRGTVDAGTGGMVLVNQAALSTLDQTDSNSGNDQAATGIRVLQSDLQARVEVDRPSPNEGDPVNFTLSVVNHGPDPATGVALQNRVPAGALDSISATPSRGTFTFASGRWSVGSLAPGDSAWLVVRNSVAIGTGGTTVTDAVEIVAADQADPVAGNQADSVSLFVAYAPGIMMTAEQPTAMARPGQRDVVLFDLTIRNSSSESRTLQRVTFTNRTTGSGTAAQRDAELDTLRLYLDDGSGTFDGGDTLLRSARAAAGTILCDSLAVMIPSGTLARLAVVTHVPLGAHDSDGLDLSIDDASGVGFDQAVTHLQTWPISPAGHTVVDGMAMAQIALHPVAAGEARLAEKRRLALDVTIPANGYDPDILTEIRLANLGDAVANTDLRRVELWRDGGNGAFDSGLGDDAQLGIAAWDGAGWAVTGLFVPLPIGGTRFFATVDVADSATVGRTIRLGIAGPDTTGVVVASGDDGPVDGPVVNPEALTIRYGPSMISLSGAAQSGAAVLPGRDGIEVFRLPIGNAAAAAETLTSIAFTNLTRGPGLPAQLDAEWRPLRLLVDAAPVATASFTGGRVQFSNLDVVLAPRDTVILTLQSGASTVARDGDELDLALDSPADLTFTRAVELVGAWPLDPVGGFAVDGMSLAQIALANSTSPDLPTGSVRRLALDVTVPGNGYQADTLQFLLVRNAGNAAALTDVRKVEAWADDGNGTFEPADAPGAGDALLGSLFYTGDAWALGGISVTVPPSGQRIFLSCDIAREASEGRTVRFGITTSPIAGLGMTSDNDGPRDGEALNPTALVISTENRVTFTTQGVAPGTASPGDTSVVLMHLVGRNSYPDSTRTLTALTLTNDTRGASIDPAVLDAEIQLLQLRADATDGPILESAFYARGKATFSGFAWAIPPGASRDLYVTAEVSELAATDGDVLGTRVAEEADLRFAESTSLSARFPLTSGAQWTLDGMTAGQIALVGTPAATLGPNEGPALALDWIVPRNGYVDDVLEGVRLVNVGNADPSELSEMRLWRDGGNGAFDAGATDDQDLGPMILIGGRWVSSALSSPIGATGVRLFASIATGATVADSSTVQLRIPVDGIVVQSGNDGPIDKPLTHATRIVISTSHLLASISLDRVVSVLGDTVRARMDVRNVGELAITDIAPTALAKAGDGALRLIATPSPPSLDLAPGTSGSFVWTFVSDTAGTVSLAAGATGTEIGTGAFQRALETATNDHRIFSQARNLELYTVESMPFSVDRGQTQIVPLTLTLTNPGGEGVSDVLLRRVSLRLEDAAGAGVVPGALLSRVVLNEGATVYLDLTGLPASGSGFDLTLPRPIRIESGASSSGQVTLSLSLDLDPNTTVPSFRVVIADADAFSADDATNGAPVSVVLVASQSFPVRSGIARVVAGATELDVAAVTMPAASAGRSQAGVPALELTMNNPGPVGLGPDIEVATFAVSLVDSSGAVVSQPARVYKRIRVTTPTLTLLDRPLTSNDGAAIALPLSPFLTLRLNTPTTVTVAVDVADSADLGTYRLQVADTSHVVARNASTGARLPSVFAADPLAGATVTIQSRADTVLASARPGFPAAVPVGTSGVTAMTVALRHPGASDAASIRIDRLTVRCRDPLNNLLAPSLFLDRARVVRGGADVGEVTSFSLSGGEFTVAIAGVEVAPGETDSLALVVDLEATAPAVLFQMTVIADGVVAYDHNLGTRVAVAPDDGVEFPLGSGVTQLEAPARELAAGFVESMPAALVADGIPVPAARLTLRNTSVSGIIRVDHLELVAADGDFGALAVGPVASALQAFVADTLWAGTGPLSPGATTATLVATTPLVLSPDAPITIELRVAARDGGVAAFRLGCRADGIGVMQPSSPLLSVAIAAEEGQTFPFWTRLGSLSPMSIEESYSNFPNPFAAGREQSRFVFYMRTTGRVSLRLWTARGDPVLTLLDGTSFPPGLQQGAAWDGRNGRGEVVVNGAYIAELEIAYDDGGHDRLRRKIAVVR